MKKCGLKLLLCFFVAIVILSMPINSQNVYANEPTPTLLWTEVTAPIENITLSNPNLSFDDATTFAGKKHIPDGIVWVIYASEGTNYSALLYQDGDYYSDDSGYTIAQFNAYREINTFIIIGTYNDAKTDPEVTTDPVAATGLVYDGTEKQLLASAPVVSGGTVAGYAVVTGDTEPTDDAYTINSYTDVKATAAGTYKVYYKVTGDATHNNKVFGPVTVTIEAGSTLRWTEVTEDIETITLSNPNLSEDDAKAFVVENTIPSDGLVYVIYASNGASYRYLAYRDSDFLYSSTGLTIEQINYFRGDYTFYIIGTYTAAKTDPTVDTNATAATGLVYDGNEKQLLTSEPVVSGGTVTGYAVVTGDAVPADDAYTIASYTDVKATAAGTYKVYYKVEGDATHNNKVFGPVTVTIDAPSYGWTEVTAPIGTITLSDPNLSFDDAMTVVGQKTIPDGYVCVIYASNGAEYSTIVFSDRNILFSETCEISSLELYRQYYFVYIIGTYTAAKTDPTVTTNAVAATNLVYDGNEKQLLTSAPVVSGGTLAGYAVATGDDEPAADAYNITSYADVKATAAGTYKVYYKVTGDATHNNKVFGPVTVTIEAGSTLRWTEVTEDIENITLSNPNLSEDDAKAFVAEKDIPKGNVDVYVIYASSGAKYSILHYFDGVFIFSVTDEIASVNSFRNEYKFYIIGTYNDAKTDPTVTTNATAATGLVYDGTEKQLLTSAPVVSGGTVAGYAVATGDTEPADDAYTIASYTDVKATAAGTYKVYYKVTGDATHNNKVFGPVEVTIAKAAGSGSPNASAVAPTSSSASDGKITGVDDTMEYATYDPVSGEYGEYVTVTGTAITGLSARTKIKVRVKETANTEHGTDKEVTVPSYIPPYPDGGNGVTPDSVDENKNEFTVPVKGNDTVQVAASIRANNAVLRELTETNIAKMFEDTASDTAKAITIDLSEAEEQVNKVTITKNSVKNIVKAAKDEETPVEGLEVKLSNASMKLDNKAVNAVNDQAEGNYVELIVEDSTEAKLNEAQQKALSGQEIAGVINARIESNGVEIHDFNGGNVEVSFAFLCDDAKKKDCYFVWYLAKNGEIEKFATKYKDGKLSFVTGHLSDYVVVYDESAADDKEDDRASKTEKTEKLPYFKMSKIIGLGNRFSFSVTNVAEDATIKYTTSNKKIATVNKKGTVKAVGLGKCTVTGKITQNGVTYKFVLAVTVKETGTGNRSIKEAKCVTPENEQPLLNVYKLVYTDSPVKLTIKDVAKDAKVTYTSENEKIATVSDKGVITGIKKGYTGINVTVEQSGQTYSYRVYVRVKYKFNKIK